MKTLYTGGKLEDGDMQSGSIFLAGPTPRPIETGSGTPKSWRPEALALLESYRFEGLVFVPEHPETGAIVTGDDQIEWEWAALIKADVIAFWVPRRMTTMPALTTNIEFGMWMRSNKIVFGAPPNAEHVGYMRYACSKHAIPDATTLEATMHMAVLKNALGYRDREPKEGKHLDRVFGLPMPRLPTL